MPKKPPKRGTTPKFEATFGAVVNTLTGQVGIVSPQTDLFRSVASMLLGDAQPRRTTDDSWYSGRRSGSRKYSQYQWLTGTTLPSLRDRLLPEETDLVEILDKTRYYERRLPWLNRALVLRAALNAAEFSVDAPRSPEQTEWMTGLRRDLRMFSFMREFFRQLRSAGQVVPLWKTAVRSDGRETAAGLKPISIECANLRAYRPQFNPKDGSLPEIVVIPDQDPILVKLAHASKVGTEKDRADARARLSAYPKPLVDAVLEKRKEVPAKELAPYGYHFEYAAYDRRHWEDWGFPGIYSIFPYLEMLLLADDADFNALHHYKAGILLVTLGPTEPRAGDEALIATESELKAIDAKLVDLAKARLPAWAARGDLRVQWIVPPADIINDAKVKSAKEKVFDWLGIPKVAWPGQDLQGAFAAAQVTLKFLKGESKDERDLARELFERWFYERARSSNQFEKAIWPTVRFDQTVFDEPATILRWAQLFLQMGGADMQTIAELADMDVEVWAARRKEIEALQKDLGVKFDPITTPARTTPSNPEGRPTTVNQPTPERDADAPQPRPSTTAEKIREAVEVGVVE